MIRGNVERVEVVVLRFDFGAEHYRKSVPLKIPARVFDDAAHRMNRTALRRNRRKRYVDASSELLVEVSQFQMRLRIGQRGFHGLCGFIDDLSGGGAFAGGQLADAPAQQREFATSSQVGDANGFECGSIRSS